MLSFLGRPGPLGHTRHTKICLMWSNSQKNLLNVISLKKKSWKKEFSNHFLTKLIIINFFSIFVYSNIQIKLFLFHWMRFVEIKKKLGIQDFNEYCVISNCKASSVNIISRLMLSDLVWPKVITISGTYCISKPDYIMI